MRLVAVAGGAGGTDRDKSNAASSSAHSNPVDGPVGGSNVSGSSVSGAINSGVGVVGASSGGVRVRSRQELIDEDLELLAVATSSGVVPTPQSTSSSSFSFSSAATTTTAASSTTIQEPWQVAKADLRGHCVQIIHHACALLSACKELLGIEKHQQVTTQSIMGARKQAMVSFYACCSTFFHGLETLSLGNNEGVVGACVSPSLKYELRRVFGLIEQHFFRRNNNNMAVSTSVGGNNAASIRGSENSRQVTAADVCLDQLGNSVETFPLNKKQRACMKTIGQLAIH